MTMLYGILQWILSVAEIYLCYYFCDVLMDKVLLKQNRLYIGMGSIIIGTLLDINRYIVFMSYFMILLQCILIFITLIKRCRNKTYCFGIIMTYNVYVALLQLFNAFVLLIAVKTMQVDDIYFELNIYRMFCYLVSLLILYGMTVVLSKYNKSNAISCEPSKWIFLIYGGIGILVVLMFQTQMLTYGKNESMKNTFFLSLLIVLTLVGFFLYIKGIVSKAEYQMLELKNRMMEEHYQEMYQMYQNCACALHDFKHHLVLLEDYCRSGENRKALEYMAKIRTPIQSIEDYIKSGNEIMDLVLNFKLTEAEEKGITVETEIENMCGIAIEENDLCAIFSNLIDNAVEACEAIVQGKKWIKIQVRNQGDMLIVKIENTYGNKLHELQGEYYTDKKGVHGYGMKSVKLKVEKYGGDAKWSHTDEVFTTVITFFNVASMQNEEG